MTESAPPSDERDDTVVVEGDGHTPLEELIHDQLRGEARRDRLRIVLIALGVVALLVMAAFVAQAYRAEQQARETSVDFAAQVETAICGNPAFASLCEEATDIIEDPDNPPAPPMPEPGEPGEPGADAPPPSDAQIARVLQPLIQPAVNQWFRSNPPDIATAGEPVPGPAGPEGPAGPAGPEGPQGPAGPAGTFTCPGGREPITFTFKGTANIGLPKGTYLICPA